MTLEARSASGPSHAKHTERGSAPGAAAPESPAVTITPGRRARPVLWWAGLGAAAVAMQLYVYIGWVTSSDFAPTPTGPDPVPRDVMVKAWILQGAFGLGAVVVIAGLVWACFRARRLTFPSQMWIAWVAIIWLDPWANMFRPQMMFNSYYVNMGSWAGHIPWWVAPNGHLLPQPFLVETANFMSMVVVTIAGAKLMSYLKRRRPDAGLVGVFVPTWVAMAVFVFVIEELVVIRLGWVWWSSNLDALTMWSGTQNAMPLLEMILWGFTITVLSYMAYTKDTFGQAPFEHGLDRVNVDGAARTTLSTFALIGVATFAMGVYSIASAILGIYTGDTPTDVPSYFTNGICGEAGTPPCPTEGGPIYRTTDYPN